MPPDPPRLWGLTAPCSYSRLLFSNQLPTSNFIETPARFCSKVRLRQNDSQENDFTPMFIFMQIKLIHINNFEHGPALKSEVRVIGSLKTENLCYKLTHKLNVV